MSKEFIPYTLNIDKDVQKIVKINIDNQITSPTHGIRLIVFEGKYKMNKNIPGIPIFKKELHIPFSDRF